jgi:4-hydroxy-tetrahydrodipicolinate reductase
MTTEQAKPLRLIVLGAGGRVGRLLLKAIAQTPNLVLAGAVVRGDSSHIGLDAGNLAGLLAAGVVVSDDLGALAEHADAMVDFTSPEASVAAAALAARHALVHVVGTTGLEEAHLAAIAASAQHAVIVRSGNMSLGVNVLAMLVQQGFI